MNEQTEGNHRQGYEKYDILAAKSVIFQLGTFVEHSSLTIK